MVAITVTIPTVIGKRYRTEVRPSIVTVLTSKSEATLIKSFERYVALGREASTSGDRVNTENLYQHAEHYFRVMKAANEGHQQRATRPSAQTDLQTEMSEAEGSEIDGPARASPSQRQPHSS